MNTDTMKLADEIEQAVASEQRQWLEQAFYVINPCPEEYGKAREPWVEASNRFRRMLDAEAYESAAMTLVPEGWSVEKAGWHSLGDPDAYFELWEYTDRSGWLHGSENKRSKGRASTPALALCAAALRAQEAGE